jgi:hypothetical protein
MAVKQVQGTRVSRRAALRAGSVVGAVGAGLAVGAAVPRLGYTPAAAARSFEVDGVVGEPVTIVRAGSGPPQRGDWFSVDARLYQAGRTDGPQIGVYQCFGAWTAAAMDMSAPNQRFTSVQFKLDGLGALMGLINEGGTGAAEHVGAVQGGTGAFAGASGTFRQVGVSGPIVGVAPGTTVFRATFDLL